MPREKDTQKYFLKSCEEHGIFAAKISGEGTAGIADVLAAYGGWLYLIEVKHPDGTGRLSPIQKVLKKLLAKNGVTVHVIETRTEVDQLILHITRREPTEPY